MSMQDETMVDEPEEETGESSNRMFMILAGGLAALFVGGLICIAAVFFMQRNQAASTQAVNATQAAKNSTVVAGATLAAQPTAILAPTELPPAPTATEVPPTSAPVVEASPTTASAEAKPTETPSPAVTPTAAKATPTSTPRSVASVASPTPTAESGTTPQTGMGGFGMVLAAAVLLVVLFAARRLRLSQP